MTGDNGKRVMVSGWESSTIVVVVVVVVMVVVVRGSSEDVKVV